jgi:hypothetical protein
MQCGCYCEARMHVGGSAASADRIIGRPHGVMLSRRFLEATTRAERIPSSWASMNGSLHAGLRADARSQAPSVPHQQHRDNQMAGILTRPRSGREVPKLQQGNAPPRPIARDTEAKALPGMARKAMARSKSRLSRPSRLRSPRSSALIAPLPAPYPRDPSSEHRFKDLPSQPSGAPHG